MRNKLLTTVAALILSLCFTYAKAQTTLFVKENNGVQTPHALLDIKKLTFAPGTMIVNNENGNTTTYPITGLRSWSFGNNVTTGISSLAVEGKSFITLHPNPVTNQLHIQYESVSEAYVQLRITDIQGRLILRKTISSHYGTNDANINVEQLPQGIYICCLRNGNELATQKFIKQ
jgi:hypothetical protein